MKIPEMVEFFKENFNVEVSRSTVRRALIESNYLYTGPKIRPKTQIKKRRKIKMVIETTISKLDSSLLYDETIIYLENPGGIEWIQNED